MSEGLGWVDPPPRRPTYDWAAIADKARKRPRKPFLVFRQDRYSLVVAIRGGDIKALRPDKGFSVETRNNTNVRVKDSPRMCDLWVIYDPDKDQTNNQNGGK